MALLHGYTASLCTLMIAAGAYMGSVTWMIGAAGAWIVAALALEIERIAH